MAGWIRRAGWAAGLCALALAGAAQARTAADVLAALKAASGGPGWDAPLVITAVGEETSFGLTGPYRAVQDLASGRFVRRADYGLFANAEGLDSAGRWRMDNSGGVHPLDSAEAQAVALTEAFLARRGYLHPERGGAAYRRLRPVRDHGRRFERIEATPAGGRAAMLWIDAAAPRLDRVIIERSKRIETLRYGDYRVVDGLLLPFALTVDDGDQAETGRIAVARYRIGPAAGAPWRRPAPPADATLRPGGPPAWMRIDPTSGFLLVEARIDGREPMLFILDTGGHDILTPVAAEALGLKPVGHGFSLGAGSGSTPTQFVKVARLELGAAELDDQPFVVLSLNLGDGVGADGQTKPISGMLGLELFERFAATLDYGRGELRLCPLDRAPAAAGAPIRFTDDLPLAPAELNGAPGWFDLDTGNNVDVILYKTWLDGTGLAKALTPQADPVVGTGVGGAVDFHRSQAASLAVAGVRIDEPKVLLAGDGMGGLSARFEAGNIGESVLSRYTVSFDYGAQRLILAPPQDRGICP